MGPIQPRIQLAMGAPWDPPSPLSSGHCVFPWAHQASYPMGNGCSLGPTQPLIQWSLCIPMDPSSLLSNGQWVLPGTHPAPYPMVTVYSHASSLLSSRQRALFSRGQRGSSAKLISWPHVYLKPMLRMCLAIPRLTIDIFWLSQRQVYLTNTYSSQLINTIYTWL